MSPNPGILRHHVENAGSNVVRCLIFSGAFVEYIGEPVRSALQVDAPETSHVIDSLCALGGAIAVVLWKDPSSAAAPSRQVEELDLDLMILSHLTGAPYDNQLDQVISDLFTLVHGVWTQIEFMASFNVTNGSELRGSNDVKNIVDIRDRMKASAE